MFSSATRWFIVNFGILFMFVYSHEYMHEGFMAFSVFLYWLAAVYGVLLYLVKDEVIKSHPQRPVRSIPRWFDIFYDIVVTFLLVFYGYTILASFYFLHIGGMDYYFTRVLKIIEEEHYESQTANR